MTPKYLNQQSMEQVRKGTVVDNIIESFRDAFYDGRFKMGEKLPTEFELMDELGVSRNSLREAMKILTTLGLVEIRRGDGTYVCDEIKPNIMDTTIYSMLFERSSAQEIGELRQLLDENVLRMAIHKCSDNDIEVMQEYINRMRVCFAEGQLAKASRLDYDFHLYLSKCADNRLLHRIVSGVYALFENSIEQNIRTEELFAKADQHHQAIVDCLKARDQAKVSDVVAQSLSSWRVNMAYAWKGDVSENKQAKKKVVS